jgi:hypothetical protein
MKLTDYIPTIAKAVAALVTPFVVAALAWLIESTGVDVPYDARLIETTLVAVVTSIVTWAVANRPPRGPESDETEVSGTKGAGGSAT